MTKEIYYVFGSQVNLSQLNKSNEICFKHIQALDKNNKTISFSHTIETTFRD